jgi:hypothetical protein
MSEAPEKLDLRSLDLSEEKRQELLRIFPEIRTEGGKIDFDRLKLVLGETVDVGKERYGMHWPGKADCFKTIQSPSMGTLRPCPKESVNFDTTENLIIEGDNLEVLKLLQKSYLGRVKMIYIDPPYNTGNDFIYPDNYSESLQTYLEYTGQVDDQAWEAEVAHESGALVQQLELYIDHIKEGRSNQDLLFEILLKRGFPLTTPVESLTLVGHDVFGVEGTMMLVCLERELSLELIRAMADLNPECVVFLDEGFAGNDQLKTNAVQIFKTKGVAKFLTV